MDRLENYCLAYGIQGDKWTKKERWRYKKIRSLDADFPQTDEEKEMEEELNASRAFISAPILRLANRLKKAANGRELCTALYMYLEELEIPAKLEKMQMESEREGYLLLSRQHEQAWNEVMNVLEQYVELLGDEKVHIKEFADIIETGLESLQFSLVPPAIDQVIIANLELSRLSDIKAAFVIGLNDHVLPMKYQDAGILSDGERKTLQMAGFKMAPTNKEKLLEEEFLAYKAFTTASEQLFISCPLVMKRKGLMPSPYINRLKICFLTARIFIWCGNGTTAADEQTELLVNTNQALTHVTYQLQAYKEKPIEDLWWDSYNLLIGSRKNRVKSYPAYFMKIKLKGYQNIWQKNFTGIRSGQAFPGWKCSIVVPIPIS